MLVWLLGLMVFLLNFLDFWWTVNTPKNFFIFQQKDGELSMLSSAVSCNCHNHDKQFVLEIFILIFIVFVFIFMVAICICIWHDDKQRDGGSVGSGRFWGYERDERQSEACSLRLAHWPHPDFYLQVFQCTQLTKKPSVWSSDHQVDLLTRLNTNMEHKKLTKMSYLHISKHKLIFEQFVFWYVHCTQSILRHCSTNTNLLIISMRNVFPSVPKKIDTDRQTCSFKWPFKCLDLCRTRTF